MPELGATKIICISDTHCGSTLGLSVKHKLDDGGVYTPSPLQKKLWEHWKDFWKWAYQRCEGQPFILIHNGDIIDGVHHRTTALSSANLTIQSRLAMEILEPHVSRSKAYYQIRGTEAHAGQSAQEEEALACALGAVPDKKTGQYSRWELWMEFGEELLHFSHHIGATTSTAYESSAPMRELVAAFVEAGQFRQRPPSMLIRSHRHRYTEVKAPNGRILVTPGWQLKTPYVFKMDRMRAPMLGGLVISLGSEGVHVRERIYTLERGEVVRV